MTRSMVQGESGEQLKNELLSTGEDWSHDEVPCPTTFKREAINDTLPAKVPNGAIAVLSTIDKRAANESSICGTKGITELISCGDASH
jgi:hypothetical protein